MKNSLSVYSKKPGIPSIWGTKTSRDPARSFSSTQKNQIWAQQKGKCARCKRTLNPITTEYHHGKAYSAGGKTIIKNGRALHSDCHRLEHHDKRMAKKEKRKIKRKNMTLPKIKPPRLF